jgi:hypothetical protein
MPETLISESGAGEVAAALEILRLSQRKGGFAGLPALGLSAATGRQARVRRQHRAQQEVLTSLHSGLRGLPIGRVGGRPVAETVGRTGHAVQRISQHAERSGRTGTIDDLLALVQDTFELACRQPPAPVKGDEQ